MVSHTFNDRFWLNRSLVCLYTNLYIHCIYRCGTCITMSYPDVLLESGEMDGCILDICDDELDLNVSISDSILDGSICGQDVDLPDPEQDDYFKICAPQDQHDLDTSLHEQQHDLDQTNGKLYTCY